MLYSNNMDHAGFCRNLFDKTNYVLLNFYCEVVEIIGKVPFRFQLKIVGIKVYEE